MYSKNNLVFGFHGCDKITFNNVISGGEMIKFSANTYDWLGSGMYFWERDPERALLWAKNKDDISEPAVIGAIIDLGHCLDLTRHENMLYLQEGFMFLEWSCLRANKPLPRNHGKKKSGDVLLRDLDCSVINMIHQLNEKRNRKPYDSVRGIFIEGEPVFPGACIYEFTHTQLCIRNPNCIRGFFDPRNMDENYPAL